MKRFLYLIPMAFIIIVMTSCDVMNNAPCEHEYVVSSIVEATCVNQGKKIEECLKCQNKIEHILPVKDHEYETVEISATCENDGKIYEVCKNCKKQNDLGSINKLPHETVEVKHEATCEEDGYTSIKCNNCSYEEIKDVVPALKHDYSEWTTIVNPTEMSDGLRSRSCSRCSAVEEQIIMSSNYIDLSLIRTEYDPTLIYKVETYEELLLLFECAVLNGVENFTFELALEYESLETLIDSLFEDETLTINFMADVRCSKNMLTFRIVYSKEPTLSTIKTYYEQFKSFNYSPIIKERSDDFDEFLINNSIYSYNVETSEQLFYVLEHGAKPVCKEESTAEVLYTELKKILINIISDEMTTLEKVKAIHDYLVMNVVYDHELFLGSQEYNPLIYEYKGFYLEGVIFDKKAVCEGISKTFTALCNIEGIPCVTVSGYQTNNPDGVGHAWNKVYVDGSWYIVDVTSDGTIVGGEIEVLSYKYFLVDDTIYQGKYTPMNFDNIKCTKTINIYKNMYFVYNGTKYDFNIESQQELDIIIAYFEENNNKHSTIQFKIDFNVGDSCLDEISKSYQNAQIEASISYLNDINNFMIIKYE